jgi:hypothetical protein
MSAHNEVLPLATEPVMALVRHDESPELAIVRLAVERGGDVSAAMKTLYDLKVAEREHASRLAFADALARFQAACPAIPRTSKADIKTRTGTGYGYTYADFEQIAETIGPHLRECGLSFSFDSAVDGGALTCICRLRHVQGHSETSSFTLPTASASAMSEQQKVGAALTFAKRQALTSILGLALTDPDPDGAADPTTISEHDAANIEALIAEVGADKAKFLAYAGVAHIAGIREADKARVIAALESRRKRGTP